MTTITMNADELLAYWNPGNLSRAMDQARYIQAFDDSFGHKIYCDSQNNTINLVLIYKGEEFMCRPGSHLKIFKVEEGGFGISVSETTRETCRMNPDGLNKSSEKD